MGQPHEVIWTFGRSPRDKWTQSPNLATRSPIREDESDGCLRSRSIHARTDNPGYSRKYRIHFRFRSLVGLGTFLLSVGTYSLSGIAIIRTEAYPVLIGKLLLAAAVSLLAVFFGMVFLPINWIGVIIEAMLFLLYLGVGYSIRTGDGIAVGTESASDTIP